MGLEVGDIVKLSSYSKWYNYGYANPVDTPGKIIEIDYMACTSGELGVLVKWDDETTNSYRLHDLIKVAHPRFEDSQVI